MTTEYYVDNKITYHTEQGTNRAGKILAMVEYPNGARQYYVNHGKPGANVWIWDTQIIGLLTKAPITADQVLAKLAAADRALETTCDLLLTYAEQQGWDIDSPAEPIEAALWSTYANLQGEIEKLDWDKAGLVIALRAAGELKTE